MKRQKCNYLLNPKQKYLQGEAANAMSKLRVGQATKNVFVDRSAEPVGAHCDGKIANEWNIEMKHVQT